MTSLRSGLGALGITLAAACAPPPASPPVVVIPGSSASAPPLATAAPASPAAAPLFEVRAVDDDADPFASLPEKQLPAGITLEREQVGAGPGVLRSRAFARIAPAPGEPLGAALDRARPWLASVRLPPGDRLLPGRVSEVDEGDGAREGVAWRTFVVRGPPLLDARDVAAAEATVDTSGGLPMVMLGLRLTPDGAERFAAATRDHLRRRLALVFDGVVESAPVVMAEIRGGRVQVTYGVGPTDAQLAAARALASRLAPTAPPPASPRP